MADYVHNCSLMIKMLLDNEVNINKGISSYISVAVIKYSGQQQLMIQSHLCVLKLTGHSSSVRKVTAGTQELGKATMKKDFCWFIQSHTHLAFLYISGTSSQGLLLPTENYQVNNQDNIHRQVHRPS